MNGNFFAPNGTVASSNGEIVYIAVDFTNSKLWYSTAVMRAASTPWNNTAIGSQNPTGSVGGIAFSMGPLNAGPWFAIFNDSTGGGVGVVNFGGTAFSGTVPTGFSAWDVSTAIPHQPWYQMAPILAQ